MSKEWTNISNNFNENDTKKKLSKFYQKDKKNKMFERNKEKRNKLKFINSDLETELPNGAFFKNYQNNEDGESNKEDKEDESNKEDKKDKELKYNDYNDYNDNDNDNDDNDKIEFNDAYFEQVVIK